MNSGSVALLRVGGETRFPFRDQVFERVYAESVIGMQPVKTIKMIIGEVFRVLRPGGIFVANEASWRESVSEEMVRSIHQACVRDFGVAPACDRAWNVRHWQDCFEQAGFTVHSMQRFAEYLQLEPQPARRKPSAWLCSLGRMGRLLPPVICHPGLISQALRFRRLLRRHRADGVHLKARLFVLHKAAA